MLDGSLFGKVWWSIKRRKIETNSLGIGFSGGKVQKNSERTLHPVINNGIPEVLPSAVNQNKDKLMLIDVRRPEEFNGELGHIAGATLVTLGPELSRFLQTADKESEIVFICRSGGRSGQATLESQQGGFEKVANMSGGMLKWNEEGLPIARK